MKDDDSLDWQKPYDEWLSASPERRKEIESAIKLAAAERREFDLAAMPTVTNYVN